MRVAVVTPYHLEPLAVLRQCHDSVEQQTHACRHYLLADGHPRVEVESWDVEHVALPHAHGDAGSVARRVGSIAAAGDGVDAIAFLDADNWYHPDHIASLVALHRRTGAVVCTSARDLHRVDGSRLRAGGEHRDGKTHVDTSCMWFHRDAFDVLALWGAMPHALWPIGDRVIWAAVLARRLVHAHTGVATVAYRTRWAAHYVTEPAPEGATSNLHVIAAARAWEAMPLAERTRLLLGISPPTAARKILLDCGTHYGDGLRGLGSRLGIDATWEVHCFEPNPACAWYLAKASILDGPHVTFHPQAVWIADGTIGLRQENHLESDSGSPRFGDSALDGWGSTVIADSTHPALQPPIEVPCIDLGRFLRTYTRPADHVVLKLDVEGAEYAILRALIAERTLDRVAELYVETHARLLPCESPESTAALMDEIRREFPRLRLVDWD